MKCLIVYCSSHGTTEKAAHLLSALLAGEIELLDLHKRKVPQHDLSHYQAVIIGGSIHIGSIQHKVKQFMKKQLDHLVSKKIGLFLCCMREGDIAKNQFNNAFPKELINVSIVDGLFGGEFLISEMNFIEKQLVKKMTGTTTDVSKLDIEAITQFAETFNHKSYALVLR